MRVHQFQVERSDGGISIAGRGAKRRHRVAPVPALFRALHALAGVLHNPAGAVLLTRAVACAKTLCARARPSISMRALPLHLSPLAAWRPSG